MIFSKREISTPSLVFCVVLWIHLATVSRISATKIHHNWHYVPSDSEWSFFVHRWYSAPVGETACPQLACSYNFQLSSEQYRSPCTSVKISNWRYLNILSLWKALLVKFTMAPYPFLVIVVCLVFARRQVDQGVFLMLGDSVLFLELESRQWWCWSRELE